MCVPTGSLDPGTGGTRVACPGYEVCFTLCDRNGDAPHRRMPDPARGALTLSVLFPVWANAKRKNAGHGDFQTLTSAQDTASRPSTLMRLLTGLVAFLAVAVGLLTVPPTASAHDAGPCSQGTTLNPTQGSAPLGVSAEINLLRGTFEAPNPSTYDFSWEGGTGGPWQGASQQRLACGGSDGTPTCPYPGVPDQPPCHYHEAVIKLTSQHTYSRPGYWGPITRICAPGLEWHPFYDGAGCVWEINFFGQSLYLSTVKVTGDTDGDGVLEPDDDSCPNERGPASNAGCPLPDRDDDGVPDGEDDCPSSTGPASTRGCPDGDGDGVPDREDDCPDDSGPSSNSGCPPDQDGDGIPDSADRCPAEAGPGLTEGCPDTDSDGVADPDDACPNESGPVWTEGCPEVQASFSVLPTNEPLVGRFVSNATGPVESEQWTWDAEGSDVSFTVGGPAETRHRYLKPGKYEVTLKAQGPGEGNTAGETRTVNVPFAEVRPVNDERWTSGLATGSVSNPLSFCGLQLVAKSDVDMWMAVRAQSVSAPTVAPVGFLAREGLIAPSGVAGSAVFQSVGACFRIPQSAPSHVDMKLDVNENRAYSLNVLDAIVQGAFGLGGSSTANPSAWLSFYDKLWSARTTMPHLGAALTCRTASCFGRHVMLFLQSETELERFVEILDASPVPIPSERFREIRQAILALKEARPESKDWVSSIVDTTYALTVVAFRVQIDRLNDQLDALRSSLQTVTAALNEIGSGLKQITSQLNVLARQRQTATTQAQREAISRQAARLRIKQQALNARQGQLETDRRQLSSQRDRKRTRKSLLDQAAGPVTLMSRFASNLERLAQGRGFTGSLKFRLETTNP